jgi:hypothetical protein
MKTLFEYLDRYVKRGWSPIPILPGKKNSKVKGWNQLDLRSSDTTLREHLRRTTMWAFGLGRPAMDSVRLT